MVIKKKDTTMHRLVILNLMLTLILYPHNSTLNIEDIPEIVVTEQQREKTGDYYAKKILIAATYNQPTIFDCKIEKYLHAQKKCTPSLVEQLAKHPHFLDRAIKKGLIITVDEQKAIASSGNIEAFKILKKNKIPLHSVLFWFSGNPETLQYLIANENVKHELDCIQFMRSLDSFWVPADKAIHAQKYIFSHHPQIVATVKHYLNGAKEKYEMRAKSNLVYPANMQLKCIVKRIKRLNALENYINPAQESADVTPTPSD